jgi:hypothetical protein
MRVWKRSLKAGSSQRKGSSLIPACRSLSHTGTYVGRILDASRAGSKGVGAQLPPRATSWQGSCRERF